MPSKKSLGKRPDVFRGSLLANLPLETQKQVLRTLCFKDLVNVQRLNRHFFFIASAIIYRELIVTLKNSADDVTYAADVLQSILVSDHDYAKHIRAFRIGVRESVPVFSPSSGPPTTLNADSPLMTRILWHAKSDACKFLNTSMLLLLRKTQTLEAFVWNAPIELSLPVYRALHNVSSLRHVWIRLDVYTQPKLAIRPSSNNGAAFPPPPPQGVPPPPSIAPFSSIGGSSVSSPSQILSNSSYGKRETSRDTEARVRVDERAFGGFRNLCSLSLVAMDNLDCLENIAECIKACSATIKILNLSLSAEVAQKARRPTQPNVEVPEPSDSEDEENPLENPLLPAEPTVTAHSAISSAEARKEKAAQDAILAKVFDLEPFTAEGKRFEKFVAAPPMKLGGSDYTLSKPNSFAPQQPTSSRLLTASETPSGDLMRKMQQLTDNLDLCLPKNRLSGKESIAEIKVEPSHTPSEKASKQLSLRANQLLALEPPIELDMDHPDEEAVDSGEDQEFIAAPGELGGLFPWESHKGAELETRHKKQTGQISHTSAAAQYRNHRQETKPTDEAMRDYIRATHGLQLEAFSLEWIPLQASLLARALDLTRLRRLTLLEVGQQDVLWSLFSRLQSESTRIIFEAIHTDSVSHSFVTFLNTFDGLKELFMHERGTKEKPDAAENETVRITDIRELALRRQVSTLKRLVIRNDQCQKWDLDLKTLMFLASEGKNLIELGICIGLNVYHRLLQKFASFKKLYALHIIHLRSVDRNYHFIKECIFFALDALDLVASMTQPGAMSLKHIAIQDYLIMYKTHNQKGRVASRCSKNPRLKNISAFYSVGDVDSQTSDDDNMVVWGGNPAFWANFDAIQDVKIFTGRIRSGRL